MYFLKNSALLVLQEYTQSQDLLLLRNTRKCGDKFVQSIGDDCVRSCRIPVALSMPMSRSRATIRSNLSLGCRTAGISLTCRMRVPTFSLEKKMLFPAF